MLKGGWSWRRFVGLSALKAKASRKIGIPLTRNGRNEKIGRMITNQGCLPILLIPLLVMIIGTRLFVKLFKRII